MDIERLYAIGKDMGLAGAALREWVDAERATERGLRAQAREDQRVNIELEEKRLQAEERVLQLKLKLQEQAASSNALPVSGDAAAPAMMDSCSPHKLLPAFNEARDDLDAYLQRFERVAASQEWPRSKWALSPSLCLTGEALAVISRLDSASASDYDQLKATLLLRFRYTAEGYREKFRKARPEEKETGLQYASRLAGHFDRWMEMAKVEKTYDALRDLIIAEQFIKGCSPALRIFLKERNCKKLSMMAQNADCFLEAQDLSSLANDKLCKDNGEISRQTESTKRPPRGHTQCFLCNKTGHRASECWSRTRNSPPATGWSSGKTGPPGETGETQERRQASCMLSTGEANETGTPEKGYVVLQNGETIPVVNTTWTCTSTVSADGTLPVVKGFLEDKAVTVLRDTGCNTVVVRESLVPKEKFTGTTSPVFLLDRTVHCLPEADVFIDTPFFTGIVRAKCMHNPLYDVVLGNVKGVRPAEQGALLKSRPQHKASHVDNTVASTNDPASLSIPTMTADAQRCSRNIGKYRRVSKDDAEELPKEIAAMAQGIRSTSSLPALRAAATTIDKATLEEFQRNDASLRRCYESVANTMVVNNSETCYFLSDGILYRRRKLLSGKELEQLVVPRQLRHTVLKLAHEGSLAGHQGISRTTDRILTEFYWPGVQSETKRYVKSCDGCQRTVPRHVVGRAPLSTMPVIESPFSCVDIDINTVVNRHRRHRRTKCQRHDLTTRNNDKGGTAC